MNLGPHLRTVTLAVGVLVLVAGCTSSSADGPTSTAIVSVTVSPSVIDPSSLLPSPTAPASPSPSSQPPPSPTSLDPAAQEAADRAAIEAQWIKFWEVYADIVRTPEADRIAVVDAVAVSPQKEMLLDAAATAEAAGIDSWGSVKHRIYWQDPVDGKATATIADCQDQSESGQIDIATGERIVTGVPRIDLRGNFVRVADGTWKVEQAINLGSADC